MFISLTLTPSWVSIQSDQIRFFQTLNFPHIIFSLRERVCVWGFCFGVWPKLSLGKIWVFLVLTFTLIYIHKHFSIRFCGNLSLVISNNQTLEYIRLNMHIASASKNWRTNFFRLEMPRFEPAFTVYIPDYLQMSHHECTLHIFAACLDPNRACWIMT